MSQVRAITLYHCFTRLCSVHICYRLIFLSVFVIPLLTYVASLPEFSIYFGIFLFYLIYSCHMLHLGNWGNIWRDIVKVIKIWWSFWIKHCYQKSMCFHICPTPHCTRPPLSQTRAFILNRSHLHATWSNNSQVELLTNLHQCVYIQIFISTTEILQY